MSRINKFSPDKIVEIINMYLNGVIVQDMKATVFTDWLMKEYQLGHGHSMALWKYFIEHKLIITKHSKM